MLVALRLEITVRGLDFGNLEWQGFEFGPFDVGFRVSSLRGHVLGGSQPLPPDLSLIAVDGLVELLSASIVLTQRLFAGETTIGIMLELRPDSAEGGADGCFFRGLRTFLFDDDFRMTGDLRGVADGVPHGPSSARCRV